MRGSVLVPFLVLFLASTGANAKEISLKECLELALKNNESILSSKQKLLASEEKIGEARSAMFPQISIQTSYTRLSEVAKFTINLPTMGVALPGVTQTQGPLEMKLGTENLYNGQISLQQPIFTWGRISRSIRIAELGSMASREDLRKAELDLVFNVKKAFYDLLLAKEMAKVANESLEIAKKHLDIARKHFNEGLISNYDLMRAEVQVEQLKPNLIKAENGVALAKAALAREVGMDLDEDLEPKEELALPDVRPDLPLPDLIQMALSSRPELKALSIQEDIAEESLKIAKVGNMPNIVAMANYYYKNGTPPDVEKMKGTWNISLALSMPIFDGLATKHRAEQAQANLEYTRRMREMVEKGIRLEVKQAYLSIKEAEATIAAQEKNVEQAQELLRLANVRYENGMATSLDVADAQLALMQAKIGRAQAIYSYLVSLARMERAVGGQIKVGEVKGR
jgi:TolC family type I secretion outer membrane protein